MTGFEQEIKKESLFKLGTLALLSVLFVGLSISVTALAEKEQASVEVEPQQPVLSQISLLQEAELINSGAFSPHKLTQIGTHSEE